MTSKGLNQSQNLIMKLNLLKVKKIKRGSNNGINEHYLDKNYSQ